MTDSLQPMDLSVVKPAKDYIKRQFEGQYSEVMKQLDWKEDEAAELLFIHALPCTSSPNLYNYPAHAHGIKKSVCPSVVVVVVVVNMIMASSGYIGAWASYKYDQTVKRGKKIASLHFKSRTRVWNARNLNFCVHHAYRPHLWLAMCFLRMRTATIILY